MKNRVLAILCAALLAMPLVGCAEEPQAGPTEPPTTEPPATEPPATEPPTTEVPVTEPSQPTTEDFTLPEDSTVFSADFADRLLSLCSGHTAAKTRDLFREAGFNVVLQQNYNKAADSAAHTCAWTVGSQTVTHRGKKRTLLLVAVRGTDGGEWYSNFDVLPSRSDTVEYAENFLFAAEEVFIGMRAVLASAEDPLLVVCGHSRGAACANLLGTLLDALYPETDVYGYTFATPATVRGSAADKTYRNIFNLINPADLVPSLPLAAWGYRRAGTDILLSGDADEISRIQNAAATMAALAPTVYSYYNDRHSLKTAGTSADGMTTYELMQVIAKSLISQSTLTGSQTAIGGVSATSDFAPLFALLEGLSEDNGQRGQQLLTQHLPVRYGQLLESLKADN